jgi:hypothetical protein
MSIDKKFKILAVNPITGSVHTDETALLLCAKDKATPVALEAYLAECKRLGAGEPQLKSVALLIERVKAYQAENPTKIADVSEQEAGTLLT